MADKNDMYMEIHTGAVDTEADFLEAAVCFTAFAFLLFGFPWLCVWVAHVFDKF